MSFVGYKGVFNYLLPSAIYIGVVSVLRYMHIEIGIIITELIIVKLYKITQLIAITSPGNDWPILIKK